MRARYPSVKVRSDNEEALRHVLTSACEQTHIHCSNTRVETLSSYGRGANSVRTMHDMMQCQKESVKSLGLMFSTMHPFFALLVRHSEWLTNHLVRSDFQVEADERVVKTSPCEYHTGNPAPRATRLLNRIWVGRPRFQRAWILGVIGGGGEVIPPHPDGTQRHHGE